MIKAAGKGGANDATVEAQDGVEGTPMDEAAFAADEVARMERKVAKAEASGDKDDIATAKAALKAAQARQKEIG